MGFTFLQLSKLKKETKTTIEQIVGDFGEGALQKHKVALPPGPINNEKDSWLNRKQTNVT